MEKAKRILMTLGVLGVAAFLPACNSALDDPDSADVVLQVMSITGQPIQSQDDGTGCTFLVQDWTALLGNEPKNELATQSPFGDIRLIRIDATYDWGGTGTDVVFGALPLAGTVPAGGTQTVQFVPIMLENLTGREGQSAAVTMLFVGESYDGNPVSVLATGKTLVVNSCVQNAP